MNAIPAHQVQWVTAAPLWPTAQHDRTVMQRPAILRFTSDRFMDELLAELAARPEDLGARLATDSRPSYREPAPGEGATTTAHLKLYQPAHGHFYLVASSLVCRLPGLPDHAVDRGHDEQAGFVIRRLDADGNELAFVGTDAARTWRTVAHPDRLVDAEELLPMFPLGLGEPGRRRRLFAGLIPVARQEELQAAPLDGTQPAAKSPDDLLEGVKSRVTHAIELLQQANPHQEDVEQETSRFILLDLADFLHRELPAVWGAIASGGTRPAGAQGTLVDLLEQQRVQVGAGPTLAEAVKIAWAEAAVIAGGSGGSSLTWNLGHAVAELPGKLQPALAAALGAVTGPAPAPAPTPTPIANTFYVLRCVYRRPHCGPLKPDVLSAASAPFTLAPFFDFDAPA
ncbi:MAG TPA: hypothetical protein VF469_36310, partial [Kofleriaceae bacterium]